MRIPLRLKEEGKPVFEVSIADSYNDMTAGEFFAVRKSKSGDMISLLSALTSTSESIWENVSYENTKVLQTPNAEGYYILKYLESPIDIKALKLPKEITIDGKQYSVPKELLAGINNRQNYLITEVVNDHLKKKEDPLDASIELLALYYQPIVSGEVFNQQKAKALEDKIKELPAIQVLQIATFFLLSILGLKKETVKFFGINVPLKNNPQESGSSMFSDSSIPLTRLQVNTTTRTSRFGIFRMKLRSLFSGETKSSQAIKKDFTKS